MASADFCRGIGTPCGFPSHHSVTHGRSPKVSLTAFDARPPNLRFAPLMDTDFAVRCRLVRRLRLISGSCPSARASAPRFLQTPPRDDALALHAPFASIRLGRGLAPPNDQTCLAHNANAARSLGRRFAFTGRSHRFDTTFQVEGNALSSKIRLARPERHFRFRFARPNRTPKVRSA